MKALKTIFIIAGVLIALSVGLTGINILQKGGPYDGRSLEIILGVAPEKATVDDIRKLSKSEVFQLFYAAPAPAFAELKGEYDALTVDVGIMASGAAFYTHHFFGPGRWTGKAFYPAEKDRGYGYNLFQDTGGKMFRTRKMDTSIGPSDYDGKPSFKLNYRAYNSGTVNSMRDELRKINDRLLIGLGYMDLGGGKINPAPFVLVGRAKDWVGIDPP
ncbi:MAG TPA: hypothetical protein P5208_11245 [Smithellaceae bacterium]|nr:hypothetical protein [Smithellaceae bacterium]